MFYDASFFVPLRHTDVPLSKKSPTGAMPWIILGTSTNHLHRKFKKKGDHMMNTHIEAKLLGGTPINHTPFDPHNPPLAHKNSCILPVGQRPDKG